MPISAAAREEARRLYAAFQAAGAAPVETDILQPAETLLDLYGEDIRARAYVTWDPLRGEMMMRPDFTVPVVQMHMAHGADPARYCYMGEVFRRQDQAGPRANEYLQVGYEVFARDAAEIAEAEVFALFADLLAPLHPEAQIGDIGLLVAAIEGLSTTPRRKAALRRHIWRPRRFRALLDRFSGCTPVPPARLKLLERLASGNLSDLVAEGGQQIGLREAPEIEDRARALLEDAASPLLPMREADLLDELSRLSAPAPKALGALRDLGIEMPAIRPAIDRLALRYDALEAAGVDLSTVGFDASLGRTSMEYYDGFVFSFHAGAADLPPVANGGRYDALTRVLGQGQELPAVGGIIRPGVVASLKGARA